MKDGVVTGYGLLHDNSEQDDGREAITSIVGGAIAAAGKKGGGQGGDARVVEDVQGLWQPDALKSSVRNSTPTPRVLS